MRSKSEQATLAFLMAKFPDWESVGHKQKIITGKKTKFDKIYSNILSCYQWSVISELWDIGLSLFRSRRRLFKFAVGREIGGFFFHFLFSCYTDHIIRNEPKTFKNVQKPSRNQERFSSRSKRFWTFSNVVQDFQTHLKTFKNLKRSHRPYTEKPLETWNLSRTFERPQISGSKNPFFLADLDCCFFHFRGVDSRFVDLVPRTYNTFFLVLKCAEKT